MFFSRLPEESSVAEAFGRSQIEMMHDYAKIWDCRREYLLTELS